MTRPELRVRVVIAPDSFKGSLTAREAAVAIAAGWGRSRPEDDLMLLPMSDGGDGLLDVVETEGHRRLQVEVADPLGHPRGAEYLLRGDGLAVVESAQACGLSLVAEEHRNPLHTTTWGVGQLLDAAREAGAQRILVGLGGSATVDGGAGALQGLGFRLFSDQETGIKIGGGNLVHVATAMRGWVADWTGTEVQLLADVRTALPDAARVYGPQKGATPEVVRLLEKALDRWADVAERDLAAGRAREPQGTGEGTGAAGGRRLREREGTGAAGGLGFGLAAGIGATFVVGAAAVAKVIGLAEAIAGADAVVVGEGGLDETSLEGKVVGAVLQLGAQRHLPVYAVVGAARTRPERLVAVEESAPDGPGKHPEAEVAAAAERLARRLQEDSGSA